MLGTQNYDADRMPPACGSSDNPWIEKYAHALDGHEQAAADKISLIRRLDVRAFGLSTPGFGQVVVDDENSLFHHNNNDDARKYRHDAEFADSYLAHFGELVASGKSFASEQAFVNLHRTLFAGREGAGSYNDEPGGVHALTHDGRKDLIYEACPVADKPKELKCAFEAYERACSQQPGLAIAYLGLLSVHINCIHPFHDGNGRTIRVLVASELRSSGLVAATVIPLAQVAKKATLASLARGIHSKEQGAELCSGVDEERCLDAPGTRQVLGPPKKPLNYTDFTEVGRHALSYLDVLICAYQLLLRG